ncbi:MAG: hypothetical protein R6U39_10560 [Candidatus Aegiribacteria sp.]
MFERRLRAALICLFLIGGTVLALPYEPSPEGGGILVTDFLAAYPFGPEDGIERDLDLSTELGFIFPLQKNLYLGPAFNFGSWLNGGWHSRWGLSARSRILLDRRFSMDLSSGVILGDSPHPDGFAGFTAGASLVLDGWLGICARIDFTEAYPDGTDTVFRLGLGLGELPGLYTTAAAGGAGAVAWWLNQMD